ncbi:uncharacterized protein DMENIID0001_162620 [Sergentomyia squamirostris]
MYLTRRRKITPSNSGGGQNGPRDFEVDGNKSVSTNSVATSKTDDVSIQVENAESGFIRSEMRRSKSRVRSYLKRCKDAIIGSSTAEENCPTTHEAVSQAPSATAWYFESTARDVSSTERVEETIDQNTSEISNSQELSPNATTSFESHHNINEDSSCVATLVDKYLSHIYPGYHDHLRSMLVRQARDLLVCTFHGNLARFEAEFLIPGAKLIDDIKRACTCGSVSEF